MKRLFVDKCAGISVIDVHMATIGLVKSSSEIRDVSTQRGFVEWISAPTDEGKMLLLNSYDGGLSFVVIGSK